MPTVPIPVTVEAVMGLIILALLTLVVWMVRQNTSAIRSGRWVTESEHLRARADLAASEERNDRLQETLLTEVRSQGAAVDQAVETLTAILAALPRPAAQRANGGRR